MDHSLKNEDDLARVTGLPVFSSLAFVETREERRAKIVKRSAYAFGFAGVLVLTLLCINYYAIPLDELIDIIKIRMAI
jgi:hypothetical protein